MTSEGIAEVTDANFDSEVLNAAEPTVVFFWAPWSGSCRTIKPYIERLATKHADRLEVVTINIDEQPLTPANYGIRQIPSLLLVVDGAIESRLYGAVDRAKIDELFAERGSDTES